MMVGREIVFAWLLVSAAPIAAYRKYRDEALEIANAPKPAADVCPMVTRGGGTMFAWAEAPLPVLPPVTTDVDLFTEPPASAACRFREKLAVARIIRASITTCFVFLSNLPMIA
jgi:hypothetical protein